VNAVVLLDKEQGMTSHDAVVQVKRLLRVRKAGHAGTLDPLATGLLIVCLNEATKAANLLADFDKEYAVTMLLGVSTDTYDADGSIIQQRPIDGVTEDAVRACAESMRGVISQLPPMYSAIKMQGEPLYRLARKGITVERKPRTVTIGELEVEEISLPVVRMRVVCSKGTYIRSLCHDIGEQLGVGAHMTALRRTRIGPFRLDQGIRLSQLAEGRQGIIPLASALCHLPAVRFGGLWLQRIRHGNAVAVTDAEMCGPCVDGLVRLQDQEGTLLGIGRAAEGTITVVRLFADAAVPTMKEEA
jgi:tRNA pseudouridine55 synthase